LGSHGGLDRHRNDRLGRLQRPQQSFFKHRRAILRTIRGDSNANTYSYGHGNSNSYANRDTHRYAKGESDAED
jgi:hypothetical protein